MDDPKPVLPNRNEQDTSDELLNQPYDDKQAETYETPTGEPTTIEPMPTPLSLQKPKSHVGKWFLRGFVILLIAGLGALAYFQWTEAQSANNERASLQSELETIKSANKTTTLESPLMVPEKLTDKELIQSETEAYLASVQNTKLKIGEIKTEDMFANVSVNVSEGSPGGRNIILEKANDSWVVIYDGGEGDFTAEDIDQLKQKFGVPVLLLE